jgi:hypothetical protein
MNHASFIWAILIGRDLHGSMALTPYSTPQKSLTLEQRWQPKPIGAAYNKPNSMES